MSERLGRPVTLTATTDRRRALADADFVVDMVQIGGIAATRTDLEIPERYGLHQTIGDTTGSAASSVPSAPSRSSPS